MDCNNHKGIALVSKTNAIFILHWLISRSITKEKTKCLLFGRLLKVFCLIDRNLMFFKLARRGVDCYMLNIIKSMNPNINSCVIYQNQMSVFFNCQRGVMQGKSLSPLLFPCM